MSVEYILERLAKLKFRSKFKLKTQDIEYIKEKGIDIIRLHATDFIKNRVAPADIPNDGKQTPMRGHPVFIAQHATACCCRGCVEQWHKFPKRRKLTEQEQNYLVDVIIGLINKQLV